MHPLHLLLILLSFALPLPANGAVYKWVGPDGKVVYSDKPQLGATEVEMPKFPAASPAIAPVSTSTTAPSASEPQAGKTPPEKKDAKSTPVFKGYTNFSIVKPENEATARENAGNVDVGLVTEPAWNPQWGHNVRVMIDGKTLPETHTATSFQLKNIDRGTHVLQAMVLDAKDAVLITSQTVTFHMKRQSVQFVKENQVMAPNFTPLSRPPPVSAP